MDAAQTARLDFRRGPEAELKPLPNGAAESIVMNIQTLSEVFPNRTHISTDEAAAVLLVKPQTMRKGHCICGEYAGIRPVRLASRKLAWPLDGIARALMQGAA